MPIMTVLVFIVPLCAIVAGAIFLFNWQRDFSVKEQEAKEVPRTPQADVLTDMLEQLPFMYALLQEGTIVTCSQRLKGLLPTEADTLEALIPGLYTGNCESIIAINNKPYQITVSRIADPADGTAYTLVCFVEGEESCHGGSGKTVVSLVFIDNYDEVMDTMEEVRFPLLVAAIDRKLNALAQQVGGIIKKIDGDKYIFLFDMDKLEYMKAKKFDILAQVRALDMGNKIPVTLSIGVGLNGKSLSEDLADARAAMDLALGRGGDQVLIKTADKYLFYGGTSGEVGYNSRVRARVKAYALKELIDEATNVIIMGHRTPDLDCLGAAIGVYNIVKSLGKPCNIVLNTVTPSIQLLHQRLMELKEYREYAFITTDQAIGHMAEGTLLVVVDTHRPSILECPAVFEKANKTVVFDHHRKATEFITNAVLTYHEPYASSTCELVTEMIQYISGVKLQAAEADALLAGITVDTKNFAFKTGAKTFEAAAYLRRNGADSIRVRLLFQYDLASYKAKSSIVNEAEVFNDDMAISVCSPDTENPQLTTAQAADELLNISGIKASFVLCEGEDAVLISARSLFDVNVQLIMEKMGGGGHQTVAGAQLTDVSIEEAKEQLKQAILSVTEGKQ